MIETRPFHVHEYLTTPEDCAAYLEAILEENAGPSLIAAGLGDIAKAIGVTEFSRMTGIRRDTIYKGFIPGGNPTLDTISKAAEALGLRLSVVPSRPRRRRKPVSRQGAKAA
jgi:probable addiction module antidote protein